jgi:hypothetical protein
VPLAAGDLHGVDTESGLGVQASCRFEQVLGTRVQTGAAAAVSDQDDRVGPRVGGRGLQRFVQRRGAAVAASVEELRGFLDRASPRTLELPEDQRGLLLDDADVEARVVAERGQESPGFAVRGRGAVERPERVHGHAAGAVHQDDDMPTVDCQPEHPRGGGAGAGVGESPRGQCSRPRLLHPVLAGLAPPSLPHRGLVAHADAGQVAQRRPAVSGPACPGLLFGMT